MWLQQIGCWDRRIQSWAVNKIKKIEHLSFFGSTYTVSKANLDLGKNMLLLENPQFLPNHNETLPK